jgi:hypothetical protein
MSRLYFTPVDKAFTLGSSQIKDTQEEIANLKKLIFESSQNSPDEKKIKQIPEKQRYERIGPPDQQVSVFKPPQEQDNFDYNLLKVVGDPRFKEIVKNYALIYHPEWLLKETVYTPGNNINQPSNNISQFGNTISKFGNMYQNTITASVQRYIVFFIISIVIFIGLSLFLKN